MFITVVALLLPLISYSCILLLVAFALLGILSDIMGQTGGMLVILMALFYLLYISFVVREKA